MQMRKLYVFVYCGLITSHVNTIALICGSLAKIAAMFLK